MPARRALAEDAACLAYEAVVDDLEKETRRMVESSIVERPLFAHSCHCIAVAEGPEFARAR